MAHQAPGPTKTKEEHKMELTPTQVITRLREEGIRLHIQTLALWRRQRKHLPFNKNPVNGRIYYRKEDVEAFIRLFKEARIHMVLEGEALPFHLEGQEEDNE